MKKKNIRDFMVIELTGINAHLHMFSVSSVFTTIKRGRGGVISLCSVLSYGLDIKRD